MNTIADKPSTSQSFTLPTLAEGEQNAGLIFDENGLPEWLILLPGEGNNLTHKQATAWAKKANGRLPTRQEQSLLFANLKNQFQPTWYWSSEVHESDSDYAYIQFFSYGSQTYGSKGIKHRARAVRRLKI